jgi:hypothetical protein
MKLLASDLFLLEKWDSFSGGARERRVSIFKEYVRMGNDGRWVCLSLSFQTPISVLNESKPYHQAIRSGSYTPPTDSQIAIIEQARTFDERKVASILVGGSLACPRPWLRTWYGEGNNPLEVLDDEDIGFSTGFNDSIRDLVLDEETKYNYDDDWRQILYLLPEILYTIGGTQDPQSLREAKQEAKEELEPELENEDDEEAQAEIRETIHRMWVTGIIWVQDEYTAESGKVLLAWLDEFGRSVRCTRIEYENVSEWTGMFMEHRDAEIEWWYYAEVGEAYEGGAWPE